MYRNEENVPSVPEFPWIVQHMTIHVPGQGKQKGMTLDYWEAWKVPAGSRFTTYHGHVAYDDELHSPTAGTTFYGRARFYPGLTLPSSFYPLEPQYCGGRPALYDNESRTPDDRSNVGEPKVVGVPIGRGKKEDR